MDDRLYVCVRATPWPWFGQAQGALTIRGLPPGIMSRRLDLKTEVNGNVTLSARNVSLAEATQICADVSAALRSDAWTVRYSGWVPMAQAPQSVSVQDT